MGRMGARHAFVICGRGKGVPDAKSNGEEKMIEKRKDSERRSPQDEECRSEPVKGRKMDISLCWFLDNPAYAVTDGNSRGRVALVLFPIWLDQRRAVVPIQCGRYPFRRLVLDNIREIKIH